MCNTKSINKDCLVLELKECLRENPIMEVDYNALPIDKLIKHIVSTHHRYIQNNVELISSFAEKVAKVHGKHAPETLVIHKLWIELVNDLMEHLRNEEKNLFPSMVHWSFNYSSANVSKALQDDITMILGDFEIEHEKVGDLIHQIQTLSNNYTPPEWACNTYKALYFKLNEFQSDLMHHIYLENNILFPKSLYLQSIK